MSQRRRGIFFRQISLFIALAVMAAPIRAAAPRFGVRAIWVDPGGFETEQAADKTIAKCVRAGINVILPNVLYSQTVWFKSPHFKGRSAADGAADPLAYLSIKAHAAKIAVEPWCCVYYEGGSQSAHPGWLNQSFDGRNFDRNFLSPANPEANPYLLAVIKDLLAYDIDGIHLDYIRYPCTAFDYSPATRTAFQAAWGFDPQNFLDHPERIVPADKETYPIRVLHARKQIERVWETTDIERTLDEAGIGFAFISETPENVAALRAPGLFILSRYDAVTEPMCLAIQDYVGRGGDVLWSDAPAGALKQFPALAKLAGVSGGKWFASRRISLQPAGKSALGEQVAANPFFASGDAATQLDGATLVARFDTGEPAVTFNSRGKGGVMMLGFDAMGGKAGRTIPLMQSIVNWFKSRADVTGADLLAQKRADWIQWRGDQVTQLVRAISEAAKTRNPRLAVTSSGGPGAWEFYGCYRDARRWLAEGINDGVFPMNYTPDPAEFADLLQAQADSAPAGKFNLIYPGVQIYYNRVVSGRKSIGPIDAKILERELGIVQQQGYQGFCLFADDYLSDEIIEVVHRFSSRTK
jgi:uncharacterized lipoprotein YddW (UPF0748 family)